jgi:uncharacterized protein (TIGR02246 family)
MQRLIATVSAVSLVAATATTVFSQESAAGVAPQRQAILTLLGQLETGFNEANAKGIAACWTENGEFVGPAGARINGRESIEKQFAEVFAARKERSTLRIHVTHLRLANEGLALVEATVEVKPAMTTGGVPLSDLVLVKQNGQWLIESAHETVAHLPPQTNHLKDLDWLVGDWSSETSKAGITLRTSCDWTASQAFLIRKFKVEGKEAFLHGGTEIIGWDPRSGRVRSWVFDSDGGFGENIWVHDGKRWLIKYSGTMADGSEVSATHVLAKVDEATSSIQSKDRVVNGAAQPDVPEIEMKRQAAPKPAASPEGTTKPAEKPAASGSK